MDQEEKEKIDRDTAKPTEEVLRGVVSTVTYFNPQNGYHVIKITPEGAPLSLTVVGCSPSTLKNGTHIVARGKYTTHSKYGTQFNAFSICETAPSTKDDILRYLGSGVIKGIGEKTAERIVEALGTETFDILYSDLEKVAKIPGVGLKKAKALADSMRTQRDVQDVLRFLIEHRIPTGLAMRIHQRYGNRAIEILSRDPYLLARDMQGVGFLTADRLAAGMGVAPDAPQRLRAGVFHALERASEDGHCCLPEEALLLKSTQVLAFDGNPELLQHALNELLEEGNVVSRQGSYFLTYIDRAEEAVAQFVAARLDSLLETIVKRSKLEESVAKAEVELNLRFSTEQRSAVQMACNHRLLLITGGPGCGKTTVIRALTSVFKDAKLRLRLAAPTGRASQRMAQVTGLEATTIHRLLKYDPMRKTFLFGADNPLPIDAIIVDEVSMLDVSLAKDLFSAIPKKAICILVGDKDQLPSVGPGRVFADLIDFEKVPAVRLSQLFRRAEESAITTSAHMVNAGTMPAIPSPDGHTKSDAYFLGKHDPQGIASIVERLLVDQLPRKFGFSNQDVCVLTPANRGELGTEQLNRRLQESLNPASPEKRELRLESGVIFRIGDRVCQRVNNYQLDDQTGVFNGDLGVIFDIQENKKTLQVEFWDGRLVHYKESDLYQLSLSYCMTVHRSQGSEVPCVVFVLHDSHYTLLDRQLLYTGITRAKKLLILVGSKRALGIATNRTRARDRLTMLKQRISQLSTNESPPSDSKIEVNTYQQNEPSQQRQ